MLDDIIRLTALDGSYLLAGGLVVFLAAFVRGFSGFALSALVMASLASIIPPLELIPLCWFLEMVAGLMLLRGGVRDADGKIVTGLVLGSVVAVPAGLALTISISVAASKQTALAIILVLVLLQLFRVRWRFLATKPGLYAAGLVAGLATGLAGVGGMVVALYVLAQELPARGMRASLVMFLFFSNAVSPIYLIYFGLIDAATLTRAALSVPLVVCGVYLGALLFRPSLERFYRVFCLLLLFGLALFGLMRAAGIL